VVENSIGKLVKDVPETWLILRWSMVIARRLLQLELIPTDIAVAVPLVC